MSDHYDQHPALVYWGRSDHAYSRNGILRAIMAKQGWTLREYAPRWLDAFGLGAGAHLAAHAKCVWVPCFRQRDMASAKHFAKKHRLPLVFDPLISAYDKQVFERRKFAEGSSKARKLLAWERRIFAMADLVIADTHAHATYFHEALGVPKDRLAVIPVGANEDMFHAMPPAPLDGRRPRVLFFGSFIHLQGPEVIAEAARHCPEADWFLLGDGPLKEEAIQASQGMAHIHFEPYPGYGNLPDRIANADIVMGVFSDSMKAGRVVPNKIWQAMAVGRPVISRDVVDGAFDWQASSHGVDAGVLTVPPRDPHSLAAAVKRLLTDPQSLPAIGAAARSTFEHYGSYATITKAFNHALAKIGAHPANSSHATCAHPSIT